MLPCSYSRRGCPRQFSSDLGRRAHHRKCFWKGEISKKRNVGRQSVPITLGGPGQRLLCDDILVQNLELPEQQHEFIQKSNQLSVTVTCNAYVPSTKYNHLSEAEREFGRSLYHISKKCGNKSVNDIILMMKNPDFNLERFIMSMETIRDCKNLVQCELENVFHKYGFKRVSVVDKQDKGISYEIYFRSPVEVLKSQIRTASSSSTAFNIPSTTFSSESDFGHPMMAELGRYGASAVKQAIINRSEQDIYWRTQSDSGESSFVGLLQVYSDKSRTTLKESAFIFHPLHLTLLNFSESHRRENIVSGKTFVAFLPVKFRRTENDTEFVEKLMSREVRLRLLHHTLQLIFDELKEVCYVGFQCEDAERNLWRCHPCLAAYCCDLPEAKDMSSVKNGNSGLRNCHRCLTQTENFQTYCDAPVRNGVETTRLIAQAMDLKKNGNVSQAKELLKPYSLVDQLPWMTGFPFVGLHPTLDLHAMFTYEPLHNLYLGVSKELKRGLAERLRSETLFTSAMKTKGGISRTFKAVRMKILNGVNRMLSHIESNSPATGLHIDFSSSGKDDNGNGLYGEDGKLIGMLEGKEYRSIDMIFPFVGMMVDRCCTEENNPVTTRVSVQYANIISLLFSHKDVPTWNELKLKRLETMVRSFKQGTAELYSEYHPSGLKTEKFHLLDHVVQDVRRLGGIRWGDAGLFEYAHTMVKNAYRSGSKRRASAMEETISNLMVELFRYEHTDNVHDDAVLYRNKRNLNKQTRPSKTRSLAMERDSGALVTKGNTFDMKNLAECRSVFRKIRKAEENDIGSELKRLKGLWNQFDCVIREILDEVGEDGTRILCRLIDDKMTHLGIGSHELRISKVMSGYVAGRESPDVLNYDENQTGIVMKESSRRYSQRFISGRGFYSNNSIRQDCVLISHESDEEKTERLWVGKLLMLLRLVPKGGSTNIFVDGNEDNEEDGSLEFVFVQYFDVQPPKDQMDEELGCIRLSWAMDTSTSICTGSQSGRVEEYSKWFDLVSVTTLRGVVHVIRGDYGIEGRCITKEMNAVPWADQHFYIDRFHHDHTEREYYIR